MIYKVKTSNVGQTRLFESIEDVLKYVEIILRDRAAGIGAGKITILTQIK